MRPLARGATIDSNCTKLKRPEALLVRLKTMQLEDIRDMGDALTRAREQCQEAQYDKGLELFTKTLARLRTAIRRMSKMSERQPWLQLQMELENELNLYTDYAELLQAFKTPPGGAAKRKHHVARAPGPVDDETQPTWDVVTHESRKARDERDPDVWAPPSPEQQQNAVGRGRVGGGARAPPPWANADNNNRNRVASKSPVQPNANARGARDAPSGRRTPSDDQRAKARPALDNRRANNNNPVKNANAARGGNAKADANNKPVKPPSADLIGGKQKYSEFAREQGMVDLDLIEMIERDIVDTATKITFDHIAGLEHTKQLLQEAVMLPQIAPHLFTDGRLKPCSGVLMFGPPGTGKTLLAKAVANVCNSTFFNVSASTLASKYRGESEKMVRVLFDMARYYSPAIIFMDEIDAIAGARGGAQEHESSRRVKTELLVQMNGVASGDPGDPNNRVMVLAATNLPWELDEAMRRRLTKRVYIPLPMADGRRQLFQLNLAKVDVAADIDYDKLVAATDGYSGDDICGLCETAKMMPVKRLYTPEVLKELHRKKQEGASEEELKAHEKNALVVTWADFQTALENVSKSVGADQLERFAKWEDEFGSK